MDLPVDLAPEQPGSGVHVELSRQVEPRHPLLPHELLKRERLVLAGLPAFHVEEAGLGAHPQVQVFGLERVGEARRADRPGQLALQVLLKHRHAHAGVGLG
ncbi:hypothetical protein D3C78_1538000 [compost metagenome]